MDIEEKISDVKQQIYTLQDEVQDVLEMFENTIKELEKNQNEDSEECFKYLLEQGFTIGTKFTYRDKSIWTIDGINNRGFVAHANIDGETRRGLVPAHDLERIKEFLPQLNIVEVQK